MARSFKEGATIAQVAEAAGVSQSTVSRVMNGRSTVAPAIVERVLAAADKLRYRPSSLARSLSLGRTETLAVVVPDLGNPYFLQILRGAMSGADEHGYRVLVTETRERVQHEAKIALEARSRCDALALVAPRMPDAELAALLLETRPAVVVNRTVDVPGVPQITIDHTAGIRAIAEHLVSLGHRELVYVSGPQASVSNTERLAGLRAIAGRLGLTVATVDGGSSIDVGYRVAEEVLDSGATAVVAYNDLVAYGLVGRLNETGVAVPGDISVVGFDDIEIGRFATPPLTTASVPQEQIGRRAWELIEARMNAYDGHRGEAPLEQVPATLVVRGSTGPVPPARRLPIPSSGTAGLGSAAAAGSVRAVWRTDGDPTLWALDTPLARATSGEGMPTVHSPRPHLDPVHSLRHRPMTEVSPVDHRHQYGVSLTVADVDGTSYWGGRTYLPGQGPTLLANHGRQVRTAVRVADDGATLEQDVRWYDHDGAEHLLEHRTLTGVLLPEVESWALAWSSRLFADRRPLTFSSPAVNGRPGAGYGGIFWRLPLDLETVVRTPDAEGEAAAHGSRGSWVAICRRHTHGWTTLLLVQPEPDPLPWFVRASDYIGAGPALAWDAATTIAAGRELRTSIVAVVVDRALDMADADDVVQLALGRLRATRSRTEGCGGDGPQPPEDYAG
ncbi:substrate-binding domain-containing protein [Phytoactinopolyspora halotolerans]|uniref:Substrate-binding domain-containing protein n=2 Tax=Phytoactinopolyspora halotolerans TaxID=1981512 RepID=A0A6L9SK55_9ACTN|nr:substrate-binding domain-containing protein [Phytoactinopolyspora halotolerans]